MKNPLNVKSKSQGRKQLINLLRSGKIFNVTYICPFTEQPVKVNAIVGNKSIVAPNTDNLNALAIYEMGTGRVKKNDGRRVGLNIIPVNRIVLIRAGEVTFDFREDNYIGFWGFAQKFGFSFERNIKTECRK